MLRLGPSAEAVVLGEAAAVVSVRGQLLVLWKAALTFRDSWRRYHDGHHPLYHGHC